MSDSSTPELPIERDPAVRTPPPVIVSPHQEILPRVLTAVAEHFTLEPAELSTSTRFAEDLLADSLDTFELIMELEDEFEITITDEDGDKLKTIGDVVAFIADKVPR